MARPIKQGLEYFPLDVDVANDDKFIDIECEHGMAGCWMVLRVLCEIYRMGYCYQWSDGGSRRFARRMNESPEKVEKVISTALEVGLFSEKVLSETGYLTSRGIQKRYLEASRRRKRVELIENTWIYSELPNQFADTLSTPCAQNVDCHGGETGKGKERKVEEKGKDRKRRENSGEERRAPHGSHPCDSNDFTNGSPRLSISSDQYTALAVNYFDGDYQQLDKQIDEATDYLTVNQRSYSGDSAVAYIRRWNRKGAEFQRSDSGPGATKKKTRGERAKEVVFEFAAEEHEV